MSGRPTVAFVDHSFHEVTRSSRFFTDILKEAADVIELECEGWRGGTRVRAENVDAIGADVAVFWQTLLDPTDLLRLRTPAVWVPMYDSAVHRPALFWNVLSHTGVAIISFCRALSYTARRHGIPVSDYTYYPDPSRYPEMQAGQGVRVFLWDRGDIGIEQLRMLLGGQRVERTILRAAPDPGLPASHVTSQDARDFNIRLFVGPMRQEEHLELVASCNVLLAPRRFEGIGMTFLEAMAMGLAVVAPDRPTMNEYIRHGVNGYLYDPRKPDMVDLGCASVVGARARQSVLEGRAAWLGSTDGLLADILAEKPKPGAPSRGVLALAGLLTAGERAKSLVPPRHRASLIRAMRLGTRRWS